MRGGIMRNEYLIINLFSGARARLGVVIGAHLHSCAAHLVVERAFCVYTHTGWAQGADDATVLFGYAKF